MHKKRLLKLADLLEADAKNKKGIKFDMGTWGVTEYGNLSCGTQACAMGLAALSGAFKRQGLRAEIYFGDVTVHFGEYEGFAAASELFGISGGDACWLFSSSYYDGAMIGAKAECIVAKRIRAFVAEGGSGAA